MDEAREQRAPKGRRAGANAARHRGSRLARGLSGLGRPWILLAIGGLILLAWLGQRSAWAQPLPASPQQTVPGNTPPPPPTPVPTATPTFTPPPPPPPPPPTATAAPSTPTASPTPTATATPAPTFGLILAQELLPPLVWQGKAATILFTVTNPGGEAALDVVLRDALPPELTVVGVADPGGGEALLDADPHTGAPVLEVSWASLPPGAQVTVQLLVEVGADVPDGAVIDNIAVVSAANAESSTAGLSIGMPPKILPDFLE